MTGNAVQAGVGGRRTRLSCAVALAAALLALLACAPAQGPRLPNIIVILADDLGWRDTGVYGSELFRTPAIDRLAAEGVRFGHAYAANPLCSPTRASLLTGRYPSRLRLTAAEGHLDREVLDPGVEPSAPGDRPALAAQSRTRLPNEEVTYAEVLRGHGYRTAFMGKWHLGHAPFLPERQGFDLVVGGRAHSGPPPPGHFGPWQLDTLPSAPPGTPLADVLTDRAIEFIDADPGRPFLLNLWFYDVHAPFQATPEDIAAQQARIAPGMQQRSPTMAAMIETMDRNIGRLTAALAERGLAANTFVVFLSDNGGNMYDRIDGGVPPTSNHPLRSGKGNNYEGGVRVPLIVRGPGLAADGRVVDVPVGTVDLFPTLLELVGLPLQPADHVDGHSFAAALRGEPFERGPLFSHFPHYVDATDNLPNTSVREGRWKLYRFFFDGERQADRFELYDLDADPGEATDLAVVEPEVVARLAALIEQHLVETAALLPRANPAFGIDGDWTGAGHARLEVVDGALRVESSGQDPMLVASFRADAAAAFELTFSMASDSDGFGQLFWADTGNGSFNEADSVRFPVTHDGDWHAYTVPFRTRAGLRRLRLDPSRAPGTLRLRDLQLRRLDPATD